jgi:hypothetical protein
MADEVLTPEEAAAVNREVNAYTEAQMQKEIAEAERMSQLELQLQELQKAYSELEAQAGTSEEEARFYAEQLATMQEDYRVSSNEAWLEEMQDKMTPAETELATYLLDILTLPPGSEVKAYAYEDEKKETQELSPAEVFMAMIESREGPSTKHLYTEISQGGSTNTGGEQASDEPGDPKAVAITLAKKYSQENKVPLREAYRTVLDENPELKEAVAGVRPEGAGKVAEGQAQMGRMYKRK